MNINGMFIFFIILLIGVSIVSAHEDSNIELDNTNLVCDTNDNVLLPEGNMDKKISNDLNNQQDRQIKKDSKTIILNSTSFDDYVSEGRFNNDVSEGDTIDVQGLLDGTHFGLTVDKPVNIISSTQDAYIGADTPIDFTITTSGSGTNITGIHFNNTHFVVKTAHNIIINNITVETSGLLVGSGQGVTSIREDSTNITINNSYFKSDNNLGVSTLVCAVAQNVLIENCTIEAIGFCGNLVYFTTYNVEYDTSRGYGNRNITFRNNHIIGFEAIQQSICYGLTMEGKGHTIENNLIEYDYYCLQQQANLDDANEVDQIVIRNNTIPYGTNNIAFAQIENNTFNNIEHIGNSNFTNNIVNNMNITGNGNYYNNSINTLTVNTNNANITNNTIINYVDIKANNNTLQDNSFNFLIGNGENNTIDNINEVTVLDNYIIINDSNFRDYGSRINGILTINNIPANSYVYVDGPMLYSYVNSVVINVTEDNIYFNINSSVINNITVVSHNITIKDTVMPKAGIYATENTKLVNSIFLTTDTQDKFILDNSTIYSTSDKYIVFDSRDYGNIFDVNTNTLLNNISDDSIIIIRNKTSDNVVNNYNLPIFINKKVSIISFENTLFDADITFIGASDNSNINNVTVNKTLNIHADNISIKDNDINQMAIENSVNVLVENNTINRTLTLENSSSNHIINNTINTNDMYTIAIDESSLNNNITDNYLKSANDYANNSINANFENNNIYDNLPELFTTDININITSNAVLNTPTPVNISVNYYKAPVTTGYVLMLVNGVQSDKIYLINGTATSNITFTTDGTNTVKVRYYADELYSNSTALKNVTAKKIATNLQFVNLESVKIGENLTVTLNVTDENNENIPDGNITITIRNDTYIVAITDGIATTNMTVKESFQGASISATYEGSLTRYDKTITSSLNILKGDVLITLLPTQITSNDITLTAYVTDINQNPLIGSSRIRFELENTRSNYLTLVDSKASYTITPKPATDFEVNVTFRSNTAFEQATNNFTIPINGAKNVTITINAENTKIGENLTLNAHVVDCDNNNVDETILFNIGNNTYRIPSTDGMAAYTITTNESLYNQEISASMDANYRYNQATSNIIQLDKGDVELTITQEEIGEKIIITAMVTDINNKTLSDGKILFNQDETQLINSKATYEISSKVKEDITVNVTFTGNPAFNEQTKQITINANMPQLKVDTTEFTIGETASIQASIYLGDEVATDINGGKVVFKVDGKTLKDANGKVIYAKVIDGVASITDYIVPSSWAKDNLTITAVYSGSSQCDALKAEANLTVTKDTPAITTSHMQASKGETITLTATISDGNKAVNVGKVIFKVNGKTVKDANGKVIYASVVNGCVSVEYTLPENMKAGNYNITVSFTAAGYDKLTDTKTLTISA